MAKVIKVKRCQECPALYQESEFPHSECGIAKRSWGMGYYERDDPAPSWCPLRTQKVELQLDEN